MKTYKINLSKDCFYRTINVHLENKESYEFDNLPIEDKKEINKRIFDACEKYGIDPEDDEDDIFEWDFELMLNVGHHINKEKGKAENEEDFYTCEQCGDYNFYLRFEL